MSSAARDSGKEDMQLDMNEDQPRRDKLLRRAGAWAWCPRHGDYYSGYEVCPKCEDMVRDA